MSFNKVCIFYRNSDDNFHFRQGIGWCDLGVIWTICDGEMGFCECPQKLIKSLYDEWIRHKKLISNSQFSQSI